MSELNLAGLSPRAAALLHGLQTANIVPNLMPRSAYRSPTVNAAAGGAKQSQHLHGNALDFGIGNWSDAQKQAFLSKAVELGARGIGIYPNGSLHVDVRDTPTFWGTGGSYHSQPINSAPQWARGTLAQLFGGQVPAAPAPALAMGAQRRGPTDIISEVLAAGPRPGSAPPMLAQMAGASPVETQSLVERAAKAAFGDRAGQMIATTAQRAAQVLAPGLAAAGPALAAGVQTAMPSPPQAPQIAGATPNPGMDMSLEALLGPMPGISGNFGPTFGSSSRDDSDPVSSAQVQAALRAPLAIGAPIDIPYDVPRPADNPVQYAGVPTLADILGLAA